MKTQVARHQGAPTFLQSGNLRPSTTNLLCLSQGHEGNLRHLGKRQPKHKVPSKVTNMPRASQHKSPVGRPNTLPEICPVASPNQTQPFRPHIWPLISFGSMHTINPLKPPLLLFNSSGSTTSMPVEAAVTGQRALTVPLPLCLRFHAAHAQRNPGGHVPFKPFLDHVYRYYNLTATHEIRAARSSTLHAMSEDPPVLGALVAELTEGLSGNSAPPVNLQPDRIHIAYMDLTQQACLRTSNAHKSSSISLVLLLSAKEFACVWCVCVWVWRAQVYVWLLLVHTAHWEPAGRSHMPTNESVQVSGRGFGSKSNSSASMALDHDARMGNCSMKMISKRLKTGLD